MTNPQDVIAWLVPTAHNSWADKATHLPENTARTISSTSSSAFLSSRLPNLGPTTTTTSGINNNNNKPRRAIQLSFNHPPKRPGGFVLGTDARTCDVVLPQLPGISPQHCALEFDAETRLLLSDFSDKGTQVWYDWESNGDRTDYSWVLSSGCSTGFPNMARRIIIDIQGLRFQVVVNKHSVDWDAYRARVDAFSEQASWEDNAAALWVNSPFSTLLSSAPLFKHIVVKNGGDEHMGEVYLWNLARPWEPLVGALA